MPWLNAKERVLYQGKDALSFHCVPRSKGTLVPYNNLSRTSGMHAYKNVHCCMIMIVEPVTGGCALCL